MSHDDAAFALEQLRERVRTLDGGVVVAFSGGIDSVLLLKVCREELGKTSVLAVTADSASYPEHDRRDAAMIARAFDVRHRFIPTGELEDERYRRNDANRCYFCKHTLFDTLAPIAVEEGLRHLAFGANKDDEGDFRPGHRAAKEFEVRAPLLEAGLGKGAVRQIAQLLSIPLWNKPASACLASRVPYGTPIEPEALAKIDAAESILRSLGYLQCRVRHHGNLARIELLPDQIAQAASVDRDEIATQLRGVGYLFVALDLVGYVTGSLNAAISGIDAAR